MTTLKEQIEAVQQIDGLFQHVSPVNKEALSDAAKSLMSLQLMTSGNFELELDTYLTEEFGRQISDDVRSEVLAFLRGKGFPI